MKVRIREILDATVVTEDNYAEIKTWGLYEPEPGYLLGKAIVRQGPMVRAIYTEAELPVLYEIVPEPEAEPEPPVDPDA